MKKYKSAKIIIIALIILILGVNSYSRAENETPTDDNTSNTSETTPKEDENNTSEENTTKEEETKPEEQEEPKQEEQQEEQQEEKQEEQQETKPQQQTQTETKKSSIATLTNLGIKPNDFTGFKAGILKYNVTVPNDVDKIEVYADVSPTSKAKITSGTGKNLPLNVGKNVFDVVVTAEDGTTKTYTINVTREEAKQEEKQEEKKEENTTTTAVATTQTIYDLKKLEVKGYSLTPSFSADVYEYKLNVPTDVDSLDIVTEGLNNKVSVEIVGNTDLQDGENTITVLVKNSETNKNSTYQIIVTKNQQQAANPSVEKGKNIRFVLIGLFVIVVMAIVVTFIILKKKKNYEEEIEPRATKSKNQIIYEEDNDRLDLNEEQELFKRVNKSEFKHVDNKTTSRLENFGERDIRRSNNVERSATSRPKALDEYFSEPNKHRDKHF